MQRRCPAPRFQIGILWYVCGRPLRWACGDRPRGRHMEDMKPARLSKRHLLHRGRCLNLSNSMSHRHGILAQDLQGAVVGSFLRYQRQHGIKGGLGWPLEMIPANRLTFRPLPSPERAASEVSDSVGAGRRLWPAGTPVRRIIGWLRAVCVCGRRAVHQPN